MKHSYLLLLTTLFCSCGTVSNTSNPATSYNSTKVHRNKDNSLTVMGEWDYAIRSMNSDPPIVAVGGFTANIVHGKCSYAHYVIYASLRQKASAAHWNPADTTRSIKLRPYSRAMLDHAAQKEGLTIEVPKLYSGPDSYTVRGGAYTTSQFFSAAYLRGFLQKVDETLRDSGGTPAPARVPPRRAEAGPLNVAHL